MENRYPLFAGGRILKKEALWDLRDYAYESWQLYYADYTDGVIKGCRIHVEGANIIIGKGIIKYGDFIYLMNEEAEVPFTAENKLVVLKAEFEEKAGNPDYLVYDVKLFLDDDVERKKNQIEFCRFHLRTGSVLRDTYKNFYDMRTEYDTVNLLYATVAGRGQKRLHPEIMLGFANEMQKKDTRNVEDVAFFYYILQQNGEIEQKVVDNYLGVKRVESNFQETEETRCFTMLENFLRHQSNNDGNIYKQRVIFVE